MNVSFTELEQSKLHAAMATAIGVVEGHPCCTQNIARHAFAELIYKRRLGRNVLEPVGGVA